MASSIGRGVGGSGFFVAGREMLLVGGVVQYVVSSYLLLKVSYHCKSC